MITQTRLHELFHYNAETGVFTRRIPLPGHRVGAVAGHEWNGYIGMKVDGKTYGAHRLAWLYVYGTMPKYEVDHKNGDKKDNRIANLRDIQKSRNRQNQHRAYQNNKLGVQGVSQWKNKYKAQIQVAGKVMYLGLFDTVDAAHNAYVQAKRVYHIQENDNA